MPAPVAPQEVSVDEVLDKRKEFVSDEGMLYKAAISPKSWDEGTRSARFIMSAETEDRHRDVVIQAGINLEQFNKNPVAFFNHKSWETPIGSWDEVKTVAGRPKRTEGRMLFCDEGVDETADKVARHVASGTIKAASIGFRPLKMSRIEDDEGNWTYGYKFDEIELYECSVVTVPAVREALVKGAGNLKEVMSPETIEEFLEHLKKNPAVAALVNKELFESVFREVTGNKTSIILPDEEKQANRINTIEGLVTSLGKDIASIKEHLEVSDTEKTEDPVSELVDEFQTEVGKLAETVTEKAKEIDADGNSILSDLVTRIKSVFGANQEPKRATEEQKQAALERFKALTEE